MKTQELLNKYADGAPLIKEAWVIFSREAQERLVFFRGVSQDWIDRSCQMSLEWRDRVLSTHPLIEAARSYGYSYYRGHAAGNAWGASIPVDRQAAQFWQEMGT